MANKKLDNLISRSKQLADELKAKEEAKAKVDEEIEKLQMQELKAFLITKKMKLDKSFYDVISLVKQILDSGIEINELREMAGIEDKTESVEKSTPAVTEKKNTEGYTENEK